MYSTFSRKKTNKRQIRHEHTVIHDTTDVASQNLTTRRKDMVIGAHITVWGIARETFFVLFCNEEEPRGQ